MKIFFFQINDLYLGTSTLSKLEKLNQGKSRALSEGIREAYNLFEYAKLFGIYSKVCEIFTY